MGLSPLGGGGGWSGGMLPQKILKIRHAFCIFLHSEGQLFFYFLNQKVMKIKQGKNINFHN